MQDSFNGHSELKKFVNDLIEQSFQQADRANNLFRTNLKDYIQEVLDNSMNTVSPEKGIYKNQGEEPEIFQIHDYVFVRKKLPAGVDEKGIRVYLKGNILKIAWDQNKVETVSLPALVDGSSARAVFKDKILELRLPHDDSEVLEVEIQYL